MARALQLTYLTTVRGFLEWRPGEPIELGGRTTGPDPYELLLSARGACTATTIRMYAERRKLNLARVEVRLRHAQRANVQGGIADRFERRISLVGELTAEERHKFLEIAEKCPVSAIAGIRTVSQTLQRSSVVASSLDELPSSAL